MAKSSGSIPTPSMSSTPPKGKEIGEMGKVGTQNSNHNGTNSSGK